MNAPLPAPGSSNASSSSADSSTLSQLVQRARQLYSLPSVAMKVLELTSQPKVSADKLKQCIEQDPALTTKILRTVNSSLYGLAREVSDLNQALALLGTKPLKLLVLGFSLPTKLTDGVSQQAVAWYWRHTLTKAVAAREICERFYKLPGDEAFIAGLLQDIGLLVLMQDLGEPYARFLDSVRQHNENLIEMELATLGFDHAILSARLLDHWGLPESLVEVVAVPQRIEKIDSLPGDRKFHAQILHLAELVAQLLADEQPAALAALRAAGKHYRGLHDPQLEQLVGTLSEKVGQLAEVLSAPVSKRLDYTSILARAYQQLSEVAADAAGLLAQKQPGSKSNSAQAEEQVLAEARELQKSMQTVLREKSAAQTPGGKHAAHTGQNALPPLGIDPAALAPNAFTAHASETSEDKGTGRTSSARGFETSLLNDTSLLGRVSAAAAGCRRQRESLTLLIVELDRFADLVMQRGLEGISGLSRLLETAIASLPEQHTISISLGDGRFVVLLEGCDRRHGVEHGQQIVRSFRQWNQRPTGGAAPITLSCGVATVSQIPKNDPALAMVEAASRCLQAAQLSGGDAVKSIEL